MSERASRARALPADVTHITSLLPHLDEQTVRRALTLHGNREAAIDALLTSPSAALPRAPPPPKKRAHAGGGRHDRGGGTSGRTAAPGSSCTARRKDE